MPAAKPALDEWIPKAAAAKLLGVSLRQIERRERDGFIEKKTMPRLATESTGRVLYSRADLLALKAGKPNTHARAVDPEPPAESNDTGGRNGSTALALVRNGQADPFAGLAAHLARLAAAYPTPAPLVEKYWLTLDEAVACGLSRAWLLKEAESGESSIAIRDMGKHCRGGRWRFLRDDLGKGE